MKKLFTLVLLTFLCNLWLAAQPVNNECSGATVLDDVTNWCSSNGAFSNAGATLSAQTQAPCFPTFGNDVWFSFVAVATTVQITVVGNTSTNQLPGGTLEEPQYALYSGSCGGTLTELQCISDGFGIDIVETITDGLTIGQTYFIRVDARNNNTGTFKLCINNFNAVPQPNGDCPTGGILCDKSSFTVDDLVGEGNLTGEFNQNICLQQEFQSSWYRWTCKDAGTLTLTLTPSNPSDDIDFAVFELPGGIDDCANKVKIRCEAAGENQGDPFSTWEICTGATGLSLNETDTDEAPGCSVGQNNFVSAIDMEVGKSYALVVNNFNQSGNGWSIEFGGTGTFLGPTADFTTTPVVACLNAEITFSDVSTSVEGITDWAWNFGIGATPATATGPGPHDVTYNSPGIKSIALTITSESGCIVTSVETINVLPLPEITNSNVFDYCDPGQATGSITLEPSPGGAAPYLYDWQGNGVFTPENTMDELEAGTYTVVVQDANGCEETFDLVLLEGLSLAVNVDPVVPPTCNGDSDGSISVSIEISNPPVLFDFGNGLQSSNTLSGIPAGTYTVHAVDGQGCEGFFTIVVPDFPPLLLGIDPLDISCFGLSDGTITAEPTGGAGDYTYVWSSGQMTNPIENLLAGNYAVTVTDANGCSITGDADILQPEELQVTVAATNVLCFGDATGTITVTTVGGTPPFEYSADGTTFQPDPLLDGLTGGDYTVVVRDSRGCTFSVPASILEPPPLTVNAGEDQTVDLGFTADIRTTTTPLFRPVDFAWAPPETLDCADCDDPTAFPFQTTTYIVTITDEDGCTATDEVTINVIIIRPVYIPNTFSPNGDGTNDFFTVFGGRAVSRVRALKIFSRWGSLVFEGYDFLPNTEPDGWDGKFKNKPMNPDVFAFLAEVEFIDGEVLLYEGDLTILR